MNRFECRTRRAWAIRDIEAQSSADIAYDTAVDFELKRAGGLAAVGDAQQQNQQMRDDAAYEEFMRMLGYPAQQQAIRSQALGMAGTLNCKRVIGDFLFMPTGIVLGVLVLGFSLSLALACAVVVFVVFVGSAFLMSTFEKARDGALGVVLQFLTGWLPGGRK